MSTIIAAFLGCYAPLPPLAPEQVGPDDTVVTTRRCQLVAMDVDNWADGDVDFATTYAYDPDGRLAVETLTNHYRMNTISETYAYDADGRLVSHVRVNTEGAGAYDEAWYWSYDADGNVRS